MEEGAQRGCPQHHGLLLQAAAHRPGHIGQNGDAVGNGGNEMHQHHTGHGIRQSQTDQGNLNAHGKHRSRNQQGQEGTEAHQLLPREIIQLGCPGGEQPNHRSQNPDGQGQGDAAAQKPRQLCRAKEQLLDGAQGVAFRQQPRPGPPLCHAPQKDLPRRH